MAHPTSAAKATGTGKRLRGQFDWKIAGFALLVAFGVFLVALGSVIAAQAFCATSRNSRGTGKRTPIQSISLKSTNIVPSPDKDTSQGIISTYDGTSIKRLEGSKFISIDQEATGIQSLIKSKKTVQDSNLETEFKKVTTENAHSQESEEQAKSSNKSLKSIEKLLPKSAGSKKESFRFSQGPIELAQNDPAGFPNLSGIFPVGKEKPFILDKNIPKSKSIKI